MIKKIIGLAFLIASAHTLKAQHQLEKIWETDSIIPVPESVLYDEKAKVLYVAQIDGEPAKADGKGAIGKLDVDGKIIDLNWVTGLGAPKGMALHNNKLYVADVTDLVIIDVKSKKINQKVPVSGSVFLNDVTVDNKGTVYVSDSRTGKIHTFENGKISDYMTDVKGVNGLRVIKNELYVLAAGSLLKIGKDKKPITLAQGMNESTDGLEPTKDGSFIVSSWAGYLYYITPDGKTELMLETHQQKSNTADIGFNQEQNIIYVPTFFKNSVAAYQLK